MSIYLALKKRHEAWKTSESIGKEGEEEGEAMAEVFHRGPSKQEG